MHFSPEIACGELPAWAGAGNVGAARRAAHLSSGDRHFVRSSTLARADLVFAPKRMREDHYAEKTFLRLERALAALYGSQDGSAERR